MNRDESKTVKSKRESHSWAFIGILVFVWLLLRLYAQNGVDAYNDCYWHAASSTEAIKSEIIARGYSYSEASIASFDNYADQVNYCTKQAPPGWIVLITGVQAKSN